MTWKEVLENIEQGAIKDAEIEYKYYGNVYRAGDIYSTKCHTALSAMFLADVMPHEDFSREYDRVSEYQRNVIWSHDWAMEQEQKIMQEIEEKRLKKLEEQI